jgi:SAM-dependent methyltransferase
MNPYRLLYLLGITPWERQDVPPPVVELSERSSPPGRALDVGCGTGRDAVYLAKQGWTVTGVDSVPRARNVATQRARAAGVDVNWVLGDVTRLQTLGIGDGYDLLVDRGCFHGLSDAERASCAEGVTALAAPGAQLLMFAFQPRSRGVGPRGITSEQLMGYFEKAWEPVSHRLDSESRLPRWIGDAKPVWYRFRRRADTAGEAG